MKRFRSLIALTFSLALILPSPGSSAHHACAQTVGAAVTGPVFGAGYLGGVVSSLGRMTGSLAIPVLSAPTLHLSPILSVPSALPIDVIPVSPVVSPLVGDSALTPLVNTVPTSVAGASNLFDGVSNSVENIVSNFASHALTTKKGSRKKMPDPREVDVDGGSSGYGGRDELGNQPRGGGGDGGPDDRSDPDGGGDRGDSGL
ncbi:MAG: hypothetical protein AAB268_08745 [Elusimicrobiota bacterium]